MNKIIIASDHGGFKLKEFLQKKLIKKFEDKYWKYWEDIYWFS